jgi:hypothetical protein
MEADAKNSLRSRIVTVRLTGDEYEWLKNLCDQTGSSISDTARSTLLASAAEIATARSPVLKLDSIDAKLDNIISLLSCPDSGAVDPGADAAQASHPADNPSGLP